MGSSGRAEGFWTEGKRERSCRPRGRAGAQIPKTHPFRSRRPSGRVRFRRRFRKCSADSVPWHRRRRKNQDPIPVSGRLGLRVAQSSPWEHLQESRKLYKNTPANHRDAHQIGGLLEWQFSCHEKCAESRKTWGNRKLEGLSKTLTPKTAKPACRVLKNHEKVHKIGTVQILDTVRTRSRDQKSP